MRNIHLLDVGARPSKTLEHLVETGAHLVIEPFAEIASRHAESQSADRSRAQRRGLRRADERTVHEPGIGHGACERPQMIEAPRERHHPVERQLAVGRLESDGATRRRRNPDRASGIGAERGERHAGGDRNSRTAARAARRPRGIVRVAHRTEGGVFARRAVRELVEVRLADDDRARLPQTGDRHRVGGRDVSLAHARRRRRRKAFDVDQILDGDRDAVQRTAVPSGGELTIGVLCLAPRLVRHHGNKGIQVPPLVDALEAVGNDPGRGDFAGAKPAAELLNGHCARGCGDLRSRRLSRRRRWPPEAFRSTGPAPEAAVPAGAALAALRLRQLPPAMPGYPSWVSTEKAGPHCGTRPTYCTEGSRQ